MHMVKFSVNGQLLTWQNQWDDVAKSMGAGQWATGMGGNKDQLWFLPEKKNKLYGGKRWCSSEKEAKWWL